MFKEDLLDLVRFEIKTIADNVDYENYSDSNCLINKYFKFLESLNELPFDYANDEEVQLVYSEEVDYEENKDKEKEESTYYKGQQLKEVYDTKNNIYLGQLELKLQGGDIGSFKLYVPEKTIREFGFANGDWIKASSVSSKRMLDGTNKTYYNYQLVQKLEIPVETSRCELKCVIVKHEKTLNRYYVDAEQNGVLHRILLPERDVSDLQIQEGDLIDYSYWKDNIINGRVVWKHKIESLEQPLPKCGSKNSSEDENEYVLTNSISPIFEDKFIVVVGFESMKNIYRDIIEKRGGRFAFFTGDEKNFNSEASLKNADAIIVFIEFVGHSGMFRVKSICKTYDIPVSYTRKLGQESFIRLAKELVSNSNLDNVLSEPG